MREILRKHHVSFQHAFDGLVWAFRTQPNFRVHALASFLVLFAAKILNLSAVEIIILVFTILLGFTVEMINTSIEAICDLVTGEWKMEAKIAKDVAAGMMLLTSGGASVIALLIFLPHILSLF